MKGMFAHEHILAIDANRTIKDELAAAARSQSARRRISVTDLVNPRQAYFRWTRPDIEPSLDRIQLMLSGTGFHAVFGQTVSSEGFVEQFLEYEGIVGKVDIYEDVPVELKTTGSIPEEIEAARPAYIDQLGMYCTMAGQGAGRLLVYRRQMYDRPPELRAFDVAFRDIGAIRAEMFRRRDMLREAMDRNDPGTLPRCEWWERGCDYREVCGCETAGPLARAVPASDIRIERSPDLERKLTGQLLVSDLASEEKRRGFGLNDLVFPRKAAYERLKHEEEEDDQTLETRLRDLERRGFQGALYKALRFGIPGAFTAIPVRLRTLTGRVGTYKGIPTILRSSKFRKMVPRERLPEDMSHYFDRLAFECSLAGREQGRLVLYYEVLPGDKFMVYDVTFKKLPAILAEADRRLALLESGAPPADLPACPSWMFKRCEFAPQCGCGNVSI